MQTTREIEAESAASEILELSSEQRLRILFMLQQKNMKLSEIAKSLDATAPEVHRNLSRMAKSGLIEKNSDGFFQVTTYGNTACVVLPSLMFLSQHKKYFKNHNFGDLPPKFIQRMGALHDAKFVSGVTRVLECWKKIIDDSQEYIYGILYEEPMELIEPVVKKAKKGVQVQSIFSESAIVPKGRKELLERLGVSNMVQLGTVQRKMKKSVKILVMLNEKEACLTLPFSSGEVDLSKMFHSTDPSFHEWCLDYFRYSWYGSDAFKEGKLKE